MLKKILVLVLAVFMFVFVTQVSFAGTSGENPVISAKSREQFFLFMERLDYVNMSRFLNKPSVDMMVRMRQAMNGELTREEKQKLKSKSQAWLNLCMEGLSKLELLLKNVKRSSDKETKILQTETMIALNAQTFLTCVEILEE